MPLPTKSILDLKIELTPNEFAKTLKDGGKIYWWEKGGFFVVTDYLLAEKILRGSEFTANRAPFFISRMPNLDIKLIKDFFGIVQGMMVMSDGEEHLKRRKTAGFGLDEKLLEYYRPYISRTVSKLLDEAEERGRVEFVSEIAEVLPAKVLADMFLIPEADRKDFYKWSNDMTQFFGGASQYRNEDGILVNESAVRLRTYFENLLKERKGNRGRDFVSIVLAKREEMGLSDAELVSQMIMMLVAGQITTTDQICHNLFQVLKSNEIKERLLEDPSLLPLALEEFNRIDPAVTFIFRLAKEDMELGGVKIPKGGVLFISTHAIHRDETVFKDAYETLLNRNPNPHFAYGHGAHFCLGAKLARIQMVELFGQLLERFPEVELNPHEKHERKHESLAFSGFRRMPLILNEGKELGTQSSPVYKNLPQSSYLH